MEREKFMKIRRKKKRGKEKNCMKPVHVAHVVIFLVTQVKVMWLMFVILDHTSKESPSLSSLAPSPGTSPSSDTPLYQGSECH